MADKDDLKVVSGIGIQDSSDVTIYNYTLQHSGEVIALPIPDRVFNSIDPYGEAPFSTFLQIDRDDETKDFFEALNNHLQKGTHKPFYASFFGKKDDLTHNFADILFLKKTENIENKYLEKPKHWLVDADFYPNRFLSDLTAWLKTVLGVVNDTAVNSLVNEDLNSNFESIWNIVKDKYEKQHLFLNINILNKWTDKNIAQCEEMLQQYFNINYSGSLVPIITLSIEKTEKTTFKLATFFKRETKNAERNFIIDTYTQITDDHLEKFGRLFLGILFQFAIGKNKTLAMKDLWLNKDFRLEMAKSIYNPQKH